MGEFLDAARVAPEEAVFRPALPMFLLPGWNGTNMGQMTYLAQLRHPKWQRKRLEVLQRDGWIVRAAQKGDYAVYADGSKAPIVTGAWEYSGDDLTSLCEDCHELTHAERPKVAVCSSPVKACCWPRIFCPLSSAWRHINERRFFHR